MNGFQITDFLSFEKTLSLSLVRIMYFLGLIGIAVFGLVSFVNGLSAFRMSVTAGLGSILLAVAAVVGGTLVWRVTCELWMVMFGMHERLGQIRDRLPAPRA